MSEKDISMLKYLIDNNFIAKEGKEMRIVKGDVALIKFFLVHLGFFVHQPSACASDTTICHKDYWKMNIKRLKVDDHTNSEPFVFPPYVDQFMVHTDKATLLQFAYVSINLKSRGWKEPIYELNFENHFQKQSEKLKPLFDNYMTCDPASEQEHFNMLIDGITSLQ